MKDTGRNLWIDSAACAQTDPEAFFPQDSGKGASWNAVYRICYRCPVKMECRIAGVGCSEGMWGNMGPRERRAIRGELITCMPELGFVEIDDFFRWGLAISKEIQDTGIMLTQALMNRGVPMHIVELIVGDTAGDKYGEWFFARDFEAEAKREREMKRDADHKRNKRKAYLDAA